jgi:hypothetical protein
MKRALLILLLTGFGIAVALMLGGCDSFLTPVKREYTRTEAHVYWHEVPNEAALNEKCSRASEDKKILACAVLSADRGTCTVYTHRNPPLETLGHEFLHCFTGLWHG